MNQIEEEGEYDLAIPSREWAEYEFATIEYDYHIHPQAASMIRSIFDRYIRPGN